MKSKAMVIILVSMGIAVSAWAQGGSVANGKAIIDNKNCALCHKEGGIGQPMDELATRKSAASIKEGITHPINKMPQYNFTQEQLQDLVAYLRSIAK